MKQAILTYLKSNALKDILLIGGMVLLANGLHGFDGRIMQIVIGGLLIGGGVIGYVK